MGQVFKFKEAREKEPLALKCNPITHPFEKDEYFHFITILGAEFSIWRSNRLTFHIQAWLLGGWLQLLIHGCYISHIGCQLTHSTVEEIN